MLLFNCFAQRLKHISILNCFDFLLDLLLSCKKTPQCCFSFYHSLFHFHQKTEKLNTVSL